MHVTKDSPSGRREADETKISAFRKRSDLASWIVHAQPSRRPRMIGFLLGGFEPDDREAQSWVLAFNDEMRKLGWAAGRDIELDTG